MAPPSQGTDHDEQANARAHAPATARNRDAILDVLTDILPSTGTVLEIASGTGQHACYFAAQLPKVTWLPTDRDREALLSIAAWARNAQLANLAEPQLLDVSAEPWANIPNPVDAIVNINMVHIAPWEACEALFRGAAQVLGPAAVIYLYGPFKENNHHNAPSNAEFDRWLKQRNPRFGVRNLEDVVAEAEQHGFRFAEQRAMPANNRSLVFRTS